MRRTRLALVGGVLAAALTGCTSTVAGHGTPGDDEIAAPPRPGSCWQLGTSDFGSALDQPTRLPCAKAHDTEVVRVAANAIDRQLDYPTRSQLELPSSAVARALDDACDYLAVSTYLGDDAAMHTPFVDVEPRLPSRAQWAAGARWVRCDVVYGIDTPEPAPGVMAGALQGPRTAAYRACYAGTPTEHVVIPCSAPHQAEIVPDGLFLTSTSPYPTQDRPRQALAQSVCAEPLTIDLASAPAPPGVALDLYLESPDPDTGNPSATCVLVHPDGTVTSTVVLP
jgi:hypothetical protein